MSTKSESTGLRKLLQHQLADMYHAEQQLVKVLPKMAEAADNEDLRKAFEGHLKETRNHVSRLEQVFEEMDMPKEGKKCHSIDGIIKEGGEIMDEFSDDPALDAGLVAAGQKVEHYEIATYGFMCEWAGDLGLDRVRTLLHETLEEEKAANAKLTELAKSTVNQEAQTA